MSPRSGYFTDMDDQFARPIGGSRWKLNPTPERQSSNKSHAFPCLGPGESDVFSDLPENLPSTSSGSPADRPRSEEGQAVFRELGVQSMPSDLARRDVARVSGSHLSSGHRNPWLVMNLRDLWQFFHLWVTLILGLEIYLSVKLAGMEVRFLDLDVDLKWIALSNLALFMIFNLLGWMHYRTHDFRRFHFPIYAASIVLIVLGLVFEALSRLG
jgi:hypothetical protein